MIGLGVLGDAQPNPGLPKLAEGIHLRWSFKRELGFPWHGFFLFRRPHQTARPVCFKRFFANFQPGTPLSSQLLTDYGLISSDVNLVVTEDFPPTSERELDLRGRKSLRFTLKAGETGHRVTAKIGFRVNDKVKVAALAGNLVVAEETVIGQQNQLVEITLTPGMISSVEVSGGNAAVLDLCFCLASHEFTEGNPVNQWDPVFDDPICLPVRHPKYPCNPKPTSEDASKTLALDRVRYELPDEWTDASFSELHSLLVDLVEDGPTGVPMAEQSSQVAGIEDPPNPDAGEPPVVQQYPLDLVLSASLHPALAQMVGLYWVDNPEPSDQWFDYLIVADHTGIGEHKAEKVLSVISTQGFSQLDGYIVFAQRAQPSAPLAPPGNVRCYALPGGAMAATDDTPLDAANNAGVRWDLGLLAPGAIAPWAALMYLVWRNERGNSDIPDPPGIYTLATPNPVLVANSVIPPSLIPARPPDWPPFSVHYIDSGLDEGWYSYRINGIDIFGRHSATSEDGRWFQWKPEPRPRPWYYQMPPANREIHSSAVRLLDKVGPPSPHAVEAYALDPKDPTLVQDAMYNTWFGQPGHQNIIGLRVRWRWTEAHMKQAPDTREFRIYLQPDYLNSFLGRITAVSVASDSETYVDTDIANMGGADAYVGCWLRVGANAFAVVRSSTSTPLTLRVRNIGAGEKIPPPANTPCTLTIPQVYNTGSVSVTKGSTVVTGTNTTWITHLVGMTFKVLGQFAVYRISAVNSETELVLDRLYAEADGKNVPYGIRFPLYRDFTVPLAWPERFYVVPFDQHVTITVDGAGRPLRKYELIIPGAGGAGLQLATSLSEPIKYAHVGVSAADDKQHTLDDPKWTTGNWGGANRFGNEGPVSAPSKIFVVKRDPPEPPPVPPDSERVFASPADYHSHSFYTYRWIPSANLKTNIFRALDDTLYQTDWERRATDASNLDPNRTELFPSEWDALKRAQVANELNHLNTLNHATDKAAAMSYYRGLSNDGLRALAALPGKEPALPGNEPALPGNERAFTQITILPLDPNDTANANRLGPDNPADYVIDPALRAYVDTLDGRSTNRYFYRAAYVDSVHNRGPLSLSSPPVWLPNVVPPRTPVITKVLGGDRQITLKWAPNRESDLAEYQVYRAESEENARDLRLMNRVGRVAVSAPNIASVEWVDPNHEALTTYYYRIVAVDEAGNFSTPSAILSGRAYDYGKPDEPEWERSEWVKLDHVGNEHPFSETDPGLVGAVALVFTTTQSNVLASVQRHDRTWRSVTGWQKNPVVDQAAGVRRFTFYDTTANAVASARYRARLMTTAGVNLDSSIEREVAAL
jgi:hypothetical protein